MFGMEGFSKTQKLLQGRLTYQLRLLQYLLSGFVGLEKIAQRSLEKSSEFKQCTVVSLTGLSVSQGP